MLPVYSVNMSENSSSVGNTLGAQGSETVPCPVEPGTKDMDTGSSGELSNQKSTQLGLEEAEGYVDAVISSQLCRGVNSPFQVNSNRKRHLPLPEEGSVKKIRNDDDLEERDIV